MAKLTRADRAKAGWAICWGLYDHGDGTWKQSPRADETLVQSAWHAIGTSRTHSFATSIAASQYAIEHVARNGVVPRPFWRRVRPKPAQTGEAIVRVRVQDTQHGPHSNCLTKSGHAVWIPTVDIEPAEAAR